VVIDVLSLTNKQVLVASKSLTGSGKRPKRFQPNNNKKIFYTILGQIGMVPTEGRNSESAPWLTSIVELDLEKREGTHIVGTNHRNSSSSWRDPNRDPELAPRYLPLRVRVHWDWGTWTTL